MKPSGTKPSGLSDSVESLVAHERLPPAQPEEVRARVLSRAHEAVLQGPPVAPALSAARTGGSQTLVASTAALAVAAGIAATVWLMRSSEPSLPPPAAKAQATLATPPAAPPELAPVPEADSAASVPAPSEKPEPAASSLSAGSSRQENALEEIQLLSRARQADARRDYSDVLSVLADHERDFPAGRLSEEREVLRVRALVGLGRSDQARRAGARFRRQFPRSVLLHKVDEMLASLP
jgi:hypothetical protein